VGQLSVGDLGQNYSGANIEPRIRSTNVLAQLHATLAGSGLCVLPVFVASSYPTLVPILPEKVSVPLSLYLHIHEDHRKAAHVREVAAFIAAEVERERSLFFAPTAPPRRQP
jgi:DNA-binding transcriptional LysR family regulator